ncbi:MAG: hypothetical protein E7384_02550 [Ruminococcaceae bacterium]|nr:hypothetical protein [Oscillospiraceae bacterium]
MIKLNFKKIFSGSFMGEEKNIKSDTIIVQDRLIVPDTEGFDTYPSKKRIIFSTIIMILALFLQEAFFNDLRIFGVKPFFPIVLIYIFAFVSELRTAMIFGACMGLYIDIVYGRFLGFYGLILLYSAVLASLISMIPSKETENRKGKIGFMVVCAPAYFLSYTVAESFFARLMLMYSNSTSSFYIDYPAHFIRRILPVGAYDFLIFAVLVWPLVFLWKKAGKQRG